MDKYVGFVRKLVALWSTLKSLSFYFVASLLLCDQLQEWSFVKASGNELCHFDYIFVASGYKTAGNKLKRTLLRMILWFFWQCW